MRTASSKISAYQYIALWMVLEAANGDNDISYRIALTIPQCCPYLEEQEQYVTLLIQGGASSFGMDRLLNSVRTSLFVKATRSTQLGADVI